MNVLIYTMSRAYTKSGSTEKYESNEWSTPSWSNTSNKGTITGPDSNGNYTVNAPSGYAEGTSSDYSITCTTKYGGVSKTFYFKESATNKGTITITAESAHVMGGGKKLSIKYTISVSGSDGYSGGNDPKVSFSMEATDSNGGSWSGDVETTSTSHTGSITVDYTGTSGGSFTVRIYSYSSKIYSNDKKSYWDVTD